MAEPRDRSNKRKEKAEKRMRLVQAFKQAPWRIHARYVGLFLLSLVVILVVASIYLSISGLAANAGLDAYRADLKRLELEREIAHRKATLALITSAPAMEERALSMGFEKIDPADALYITVPGYAGRGTMVVSPPPGISDSSRQLVKSIYRESLWDWLFTGINSIGVELLGDES